MSRWNKRKRRKKRRLFEMQGGLCWYCGVAMQLLFVEPKRGVPLPHDMATFEHLDDKFSGRRGMFQGERRVVLACNRCNHLVGKRNQSEQDIEELRRRSQRHKSQEVQG